MRNLTKMERKLRMIESKLNRLAEEVNDDESPEFWDSVEDILDSEGYNWDVIDWVVENSSDIIKDESVEKTPEAYANALRDYIESFDDEEFMDMMDASEYEESRRPRGRMIREGLLSQEREDSTNKQKSEKAALERAAKVVEIMKALDKEHGYTFGVRNTKTEDAAKMLITGEASIPFDQDDRKVLRALYNGLNKFCATVRKHTFVLKKDCFYDEEKFNQLIDFLS